MIKEKMLYAPLHKSPLGNIAKDMDNINKSIFNGISYQSGMPDFSRAKTLSRNTIYHVNSPGWLFRSTPSSLYDDGMNGIILGNCAHMIDVYSDAYFNTCTKSGSLVKLERFMYSDAQAYRYKKNGELPSAPSGGYCAIVLPKKFDEDFVQSRRMTYVDYSDSANCQMVPVLPCNPETPENTTLAMYAVYLTDDDMIQNNNGGPCGKDNTPVHPVELETETNGMYIMHCCDTTCNDSIIFVPSICAARHEAITRVRESLSKCNLDMLKVKTSEAITWPRQTCGTVIDNGSYATLGMIGLDFKDKYKAIRVAAPLDYKITETKKGEIKEEAVDGTKWYPISVYALESAFDIEWKKVFPNPEPSISGSKYSFNVYTIGGLEQVPIPDKTENKTSFADGDRKSYESLMAEDALKSFLDLNKTTDLTTITPSDS